MSVRKVSDLEAFRFIDPDTTDDQISDSLLEFSVPYHDNGHTYKSMFVTYGDIRDNILSVAFHSGTSVTYDSPVGFNNSVTMLCGMNVNSNFNVNTDNPNFRDCSVGIWAGDIDLYGANNVNIRSDSSISLSAPQIDAFATTARIMDYADPTFETANFSSNQITLNAPVMAEYGIEVPTPSQDNPMQAVNVEYISQVSASLMNYINGVIEDNNDDTEETFRLVNTQLYLSDDIVNCQFLLRKEYQYQYTDESNVRHIETFIEYDIRTQPYGTSTNRNLMFPDLLDKSSMEIIITELTNPSDTVAQTPKASQARATTVTTVPYGSYYNVINQINLSTGVARNEAAGIHIFARTTNIDSAEDQILYPNTAEERKDKMGKNMTKLYQLSCNGVFADSSKPVYAFSTEAFDLGGHLKVNVDFSGSINIVGTNKTSLIVYAVLQDDGEPLMPLYSGYGTIQPGNSYPTCERLCPVIRQKKTSSGYVAERITDPENIEQATNGYRAMSAKTLHARNMVTYSFAERYYYKYTCERSSSAASIYDLVDGNVIQTKLAKTASMDSQYNKSIGTVSITSASNTFHVSKTITFAKNYVSGKNMKMRIVVAVNSGMVAQICAGSTPPRILVLALD